MRFLLPRINAVLLSLLLSSPAWAIDPQAQVAPIDDIVAVVNSDVITQNELDQRTLSIEKQLQRQGTPLPEADILRKQVLERMITDRLQTQFAKESGIRVDDTQLELAIKRVASANNFPSVEAFRERLAHDGVDYGKFREDIRNEIAISQIREREVDSKLFISESEVDNYLANQTKQAGKNDEFHLAHIFIGIPEQASADVIRASSQRASEALDKLRNGADFAQVAAGYSDAKDGLTGGDLGWRPADRIATQFLDAIKDLQPGQTTQVLRSPNGFHIVKLLEKRSRDLPAVIVQTHARHILIRTSQLVPESEAKRRLLEIKKAIDNGADFAEQARINSEDGSAKQGGDLGWLNPGDTVTEFENAMNSLPLGAVSDPVQTGFGWHLIEVTERRRTDVTEAQKRQQARQAIRALKSDEAWQDWLRQLRDRAYIEYRIEQPN
jgi:peptidyl-prolyl cis-trans isomerase SurA